MTNLQYVDSVWVAAKELLNEINATYADAGLLLPTRQYVTAGSNQEIVHDCEQLVVTIVQAYNGLPGAQVQQPTGCEGPRSSVFTVELVRCQPLPQLGRGGTGIISPQEYEDAAKVQATDMWLLMDAGLKFSQADFNDRYIQPGGLVDTTVGPERGGYQAVILNVVVSI